MTEMSNTYIRYPQKWLDEVQAKGFEKITDGWHLVYDKRIKREWEQLAPYLSKRIYNNVLDLGCGFGGITVHLVNELGIKNAVIIDGEGKGNRVGGYTEEGTVPWYDVRLALALLYCNAPEQTNVTALLAPKPPQVTGVELFISLKSWGHHYPIDDYLEYARVAIIPTGHLILDIRKGTDGLKKLRSSGFKLRDRLGGTEKCDRYMLEKM